MLLRKNDIDSLKTRSVVDTVKRFIELRLLEHVFNMVYYMIRNIDE